MYNIEKHKSIRKDGSRCPLCYLEEFILLGDMELCGEKSPILFVEISKRTIFVELSLYEYRDTLLNDNTFLRYLLHSVAHKMAFLAQSEVSYSSQEEKLLHYLKYDCPDQQIRGGRSSFHPSSLQQAAGYLVYTPFCSLLNIHPGTKCVSKDKQQLSCAV